MPVAALTAVLPRAVPLAVKTGRHDTLKRAARCEAALGEERWQFSAGGPPDAGR
jgi:hypothetical protein